MKRAICTLRSTSAYSQGKFHETPALPKELPADREERTWRNKLHTDKDGYVFIPGVQFANSMREAAKYLALPIPGKGKSTYTKHFESGIMVLDNLKLPIKRDDVDSIAVNVPSNGQQGGGKRVKRIFPLIHEWEGVVTYHILDDIITLEPFEQVLRTSGTLIGIGVWRPRNRGLYGRFEVVDIKWIEE